MTEILVREWGGGLADDVNAHGARGASNGVHAGLKRRGGGVLNLLRGDLLELLPGDLPHLLLARLLRARPLLLVGVQSRRLLDEDGRRRRLEDEGEGAVLIDGDDHRDDQSLLGLRLRLRVELLAELHDVHALLTERGADRRSGVRLAGGNLQLDLTCDLLHRLTTAFRGGGPDGPPDGEVLPPMEPRPGGRGRCAKRALCEPPAKN